MIRKRSQVLQLIYAALLVQLDAQHKLNLANYVDPIRWMQRQGDDPLLELIAALLVGGREYPAIDIALTTTQQQALCDEITAAVNQASAVLTTMASVVNSVKGGL
jgi:hypothetical protein